MKSSTDHPKVAIVHEWLSTYAGSEKVVEQLLQIYPEADIYAVVDFLPMSDRGFLQGKPVTTTFIQNLPFAKKYFRHYLTLMPIAIEQLNLKNYDLIISSSHAVAKGVITGPDQLHVSYVHSPIRYAWDLQHQYLRESRMENGLKSLLARLVLHYIRIWDVRTAHGVDHFIANSEFIARRIHKIYGRHAQVIYPAVDTAGFEVGMAKEDFYLTASRMVPYKKIPLIVEAFSKMPDKRLVVIGEGPDFQRAHGLAGANISLLGYQTFQVLKAHMQQAKAFVFAAEEDFGITPVEAQACGTPVIAFGRGGALETVRDGRHGGLQTGLFFNEQSVDAIIEAVHAFESGPAISPAACRANAMRFSADRFQKELERMVSDCWQKFVAVR